MTIRLTPELEATLAEAARKRGVTPEDLAIETLKERFAVPKAAVLEPRDEWERRLLSIAVDCGVSLSNEAVSSEGLYE